MQSNKSTLTEPQKFFRKQSLNNSMVDLSLTSAIKNSHIATYVSQGITATKQNEFMNDDTGASLQSHLLQLKKSCSEINRQLKSRQAEAQRFRDEAGLTCQQLKKVKQQRKHLEDKVQQLEKNLTKINNKRENASHSSKTYEHILERMRKDGIYKQLKKNQLQRELKRLEKVCKITQAETFSRLQFEKLSEVGLKNAQKELHLQQNLRKNALKQITKHSQKRMEKQSRLAQQQKHTNQIQQLAACDIQDADMLRLKKFMTVQVFLRQLLKSKMIKLKRDFEEYQIAFFKIKSHTRVKEPSHLKFQFFNFESDYKQKMNWVSFLQQDLKVYGDQRKQLNKKLSQLLQREYQLIDKSDQQKSCEKEGKIDYRQLQQKSLHHQLIWQRIKDWISLQVKKMNLDYGQDAENQINLINNFKNVINQLSKA